MNSKNTSWKEKKGENKIGKFVNRKSILALLVGLLLILNSYIVLSVPAAPTINATFNTTFVGGVISRGNDTKGTITTLQLSAIQQNYKWKAYVGNVTGSLALADANGERIYDWSLGTTAGEVYVSRYSTINFNNMTCANQTSILTDQGNLSIVTGASDSINSTFNYTTHSQFLVGTTLIGGCKATATYVNDARQASINASVFQEVLLMDAGTQFMTYATIINASSVGYNGGNRYDFQMIVAENESSNTPTNYYFWVELG